MQSTSTFLSINWVDIWKSIRGAIMVAIAAFAVTLSEQLLHVIQNASVDLGQLEIARNFLISAASAVVELVRRYFTSYPR